MIAPGWAKTLFAVALVCLALMGALAVLAAMAAPISDHRDGRPHGAPAHGPGPSCALPPAQCSGDAAYCGELIQFTPAVGPGYEDYPYEGETWDNQYASYIRRDLMMAIQYAAAKVACKTTGWTFGNGAPVVFLDMSERDGAIPGTSRGAPGHLFGTHTGGMDIDLAYYQANTPDGRVRPVCVFEQNGLSVHHCVGEPNLLDPWRTALFIGFLFERPGIRVVGVDGRIGPILLSCLRHLSEEGWLSSEASANVRLAFETEDHGRGWYYFHYNHMHVSVDAPW